jgi:PiT family inorganic phosphate transporter
MITYVLIIVVIALIFDFANGMNDAANSIATVVATRVLSPRLAVLWAAFFNFVAAFFFETHVARTISKDLVHQSVIDPHLILAALLSAIIWVALCTLKGLPISVSHSLIGSMAGAAIMKAGTGAIIWSKIGVVAMFIVLSPVIGLALGWLLMVMTYWICRRRTPRGVDDTFRVLQLASAAVYSLSHGLNDAQKTMGIISALLLSVPGLAPWATHSGEPEDTEMALWIILSCHACIALGTYAGGWRVIKTLGHHVTKLQPVGGFCAETSGAVTLALAVFMGVPVSTTHTITGSIVGVGASTGSFSAVRWGVAGRIVWAWVFTIPAAAAVASASYLLLRKATGTD